jgi:regulator of protease activity HflC (stomatin/prohibitin superfamily)
MMLWSKGHGQYEERDFLISDPAAQRRRDDDEQQLPPVNIIKLVVAVQYRVSDVSRWAYRYSDPERLLESVAYREMVRYCASATLATAVEGSDDERPEAIMTFGRAKAARNLKDRIIKAVGPEGLDLGVEITFVGIPSAHPPAETAEAFEQVLQADRQKEATIYEAEAWALSELAQVAGDPDFALKLAQHIRHMRALEVLLQLRDSQEDFRQMLDSYISLAEKDIQALEEDIDRERMLSNVERMRFKMHLKNLIQTDYLQGTLHAIREDPDGFEYRRRLAEARHTAQQQLDRASGKAAAILAQARAYRWDKELVRRGETVAFQREMLAYQAAPKVYKLYRKLQVLDDVMPAIKKTVLAVPTEKIRQWLDHREATSGLQDITFDPEDAQTD